MDTSVADPFQAVRDYLAGDDRTAERARTLAGSIDSSPHERLLLATASQETSPVDLVPLVRHVLRHESERSGREDVSLRVPTDDPWPTVEDWKTHSITPMSGPEDSFYVTASAWKPGWFSGEEGALPAAPAFEEVQRRTDYEVPGDPFLTHGGYRTYASEGQKNAVRAVLSAPSGATLVVNLPTGTGKSQCARLPVLMSEEREEVTVVVVPTVSLAIDQEKALEGDLTPPLAYYSGEGEAHDRRNRTIRERIASGEQSIVFTSPESFCGSLAPALYKAARRGHLRRVFVDEAHIVDQWGDDFRASFQELAGMRRGLIRAANQPFETILMTATLTESVLDTLESLFGNPGPFEHISAAQLRPEPSYWFRRCDSEEEKVERVFEALRHLPRPLILYTTEREDVTTEREDMKGWAERIHEAGYRRWDWIHGGSSASDRRSVLEKWRQDEIDIVVATSAFGLGVDKADIRAVVHACLPESVDRYYQEVGRGGRDGKASVSMVAFTNDDVATAAKINSKRLISVDLGLERWESMWRGAEHIDGPRYQVDITTPREAGMQKNEYNEMWNVRTLNLMHQAGLIRLDAEPPPTLDEILEGEVNPDDLTDEQQERVDDAYTTYRQMRVVEIATEENHKSRSVWEKLVKPLRKDIKRKNRQGFNVMREMMKDPSETCVANRFREMYRIRTQASRDQVMVAPACGGCPACRSEKTSQHNAPYEYPPDVQLPRWKEHIAQIPEILESLLDGHTLLAILYNRSAYGRNWERRLRRLIRWFDRLGPYYVIAPEDTLEHWRGKWKGTQAPVFLEAPCYSDEKLNLPEVVYAPDLEQYPRTIVLPPADTVRVLITPYDTTNPIRERGSVQDTLDVPTHRFASIQTKLAL